MATYRHWSVSLWRVPDDVSHCRILSLDKTEWWLISATLCGWRHCFVADQLWFMTRIWEEEAITKKCSEFVIDDWKLKACTVVISASGTTQILVKLVRLEHWGLQGLSQQRNVFSISANDKDIFSIFLENDSSPGRTRLSLNLVENVLR